MQQLIRSLVSNANVSVLLYVCKEEARVTKGLHEIPRLIGSQMQMFSGVAMGNSPLHTNTPSGDKQLGSGLCNGWSNNRDVHETIL